MKLAFIIYDGLTTLDFVGMFDPLTRLKTMGFVKDLEYDVCAINSPVLSFEKLEFMANRVGGSLEGYDYIIVPGGNGIADLIKNDAFISWMKTASPESTMAAVCGGVIILGVLGLLAGKKATTHPAMIEYLKKFTQDATQERIVDEGRIITARGVTAAIDLGLYLCERIAGKETRELIQTQMDYLNYTEPILMSNAKV